MAKPLITRRVQVAAREFLVGTTLGYIGDLFSTEGFEPGTAKYSVGGQRRGLVEDYYGAIDWSSREHVGRFIRVLESILLPLDADTRENSELTKVLRAEGWEFDGKGRLRKHDEMLDISELEDLGDDSAVAMHIARILDSVEARPEEAIGAAKDLIESVTKHVLHELGETLTGKEDLPELTRRAQKALGLHPEAVSPTQAGFDAIKRLLGALSTVAAGVDELRNQYGTGHGRAKRVSGLKPRHARLVVRSAHAYVGILLDTLNDPVAPWRQRGGA